MRFLFLRVWLTVVAVLALFALSAAWFGQRHVAQERGRVEAAVSERLAAWADVIQRSLPPASAPAAEQAQALREWAQRLRVPMALHSVSGERIAASDAFNRIEQEAPLRRIVSVPLEDGRSLQVMRPGMLGRLGPPPGPGEPGDRGGTWLAMRDGPGPGGPGGSGLRARPPDALLSLFGLQPGWSLALVLGALFLALAAASYPVVRGMTRRLESLKAGVEAFGQGALDHRVPEQGRDEVAALARSFNRSAQQVQTLLQSHQSLLANASHELRSPLARLKMAVALFEEAPEGQRQRLRREIDANVAELDALVEEVLLASRLDAAQAAPLREPVELAAIAAEEAARVEAEVDAADSSTVVGDERLLRRALRNLLENARRYGAGAISVVLGRDAQGMVEVRVCDRGPGVPPAWRERIFEPFFRMPGHAEREGGVGLGLSLVRQIAQAHGGRVRCEPRDGGGSCFIISLPAAG
ncbi:MAG: ATP-binding protein [Aquabacterium sp.]